MNKKMTPPVNTFFKNKTHMLIRPHALHLNLESMPTSSSALGTRGSTLPSAPKPTLPVVASMPPA